MYKIMLADDEGVALEALRIMITTNFKDIGEAIDIRIASSARQLADIYRKYQPDILFLNVQMTGVHGVFSLRELHAIYSDCYHIVISYSRKTDYQREGTGLGIRGYLTKPLKRDRVVTLLKNVFHELDYKKNHEMQEQINKEKFDSIIPVIENGMMSELLFPEQFHQNLSLYTGMLDITAPYGWIMALRFSQITPHGTMCNPIGSLVQLQNQLPYFRTIVKAFFPEAIIGPVLANRIFLVVPCSTAELNDTEDAYRHKRTADLSTQLHKKLGLAFKCTLGSIQPLGNLALSLREAHELMNG